MVAITYFEIEGRRYLSTGGVAEMLGIDQRRVCRWGERIRKGKCANLLNQLVTIVDGSNQRVYFEVESVRAIEKLLPRVRRLRRRSLSNRSK